MREQIMLNLYRGFEYLVFIEYTINKVKEINTWKSKSVYIQKEIYLGIISSPCKIEKCSNIIK